MRGWRDLSETYAFLFFLLPDVTVKIPPPQLPADEMVEIVLLALSEGVWTLFPKLSGSIQAFAHDI